MVPADRLSKLSNIFVFSQKKLNVFFKCLVYFFILSFSEKFENVALSVEFALLAHTSVNKNNNLIIYVNVKQISIFCLNY